jgi:AcrR family transcriptional regulator
VPRTNTPQPRRGRGTSAGLNRARVLAGAEAVINREGVGGASIRAVAAELGVSPTAIYNHVDDKSDLLDSVADSFINREMLADLPGGPDPLESVREMARRVHRAGLRHPELLLTIYGHRPERAQTAQELFGEEMIERLLAAGATAPEAQLIYRVLLSMAVGAAIGTRNVNRPSPTPLAERMQRLVDNSERPEIAVLLRDMPVLGDEAAYERQIDLVLHGLDERTRRRRARKKVTPKKA